MKRDQTEKRRKARKKDKKSAIDHTPFQVIPSSINELPQGYLDAMPRLCRYKSALLATDQHRDDAVERAFFQTVRNR
jgi:hypothetical protein